MLSFVPPRESRQLTKPRSLKCYKGSGEDTQDRAAGSVTARQQPVKRPAVVGSRERSQRSAATRPRSHGGATSDPERPEPGARRRFLFGDYPERHRPTDGPRLYRPAVLLDGAVYDLSIRDGDGARPGHNPGAPEEWPDSKDWSLQDTDAFVLVYDICSPDSFDYVKALRQRISETRPAGAPEAPILVVGNKRDRQRLRFGPRRALAALVRRGWRCGYLECSAKYNWHVLRLFRELLRCALVRARPAHPALRLQGALHPARCSLM
ncbi:ras-like protein family member 10A isoform X1 [Canis lupus familiaris]|uniref:ras-like protein family member 10A isoform X1 n=1 Tax=Canis lupus familiaris TaxID=9615 RepID=UPI0018F6595B|nr:ras-like protein family member 10A isoform X1 [Canis lupus familiaris]